jgi:hypothetical protein
LVLVVEVTMEVQVMDPQAEVDPMVVEVEVVEVDQHHQTV